MIMILLTPINLSMKGEMESMRKIIIIILLILLIPFFIITIKDIDREEVNPSLDLTLTETHNSIIDLNNHTLKEVFEDTSLFDTYQLVSNGDFSDGTTGWTNYTPAATFTVSNGIASYTSTGTSGQYFGQGIELNAEKYYLISKHTQEKVGGGIHARMMNPPYTYVLEEPMQSLTPTNSIQSHLFTVATAETYLIRYYTNDTVVRSMTSDYLYIFNISTPIANKQYSPLYTKTFDLMSDAEIKLQMDEFVAKPYLFIDYETFGIDTLTDEQMDYWYNVYTTYSSSYDYIQFGNATAGDYLLLQQLLIDNASKDFKLYRDDVIDEVHYTMTQNIDNISVSDVNGNELFILYSDDTYISRVSLSDTTTLSFVGYNITGYIDGDFNNTVLAFFWIVPILLVGALFFIIFKGKESE